MNCNVIKINQKQTLPCMLYTARTLGVNAHVMTQHSMSKRPTETKVVQVRTTLTKGTCIHSHRGKNSQNFQNNKSMYSI